ncbi:hypothetical protein KVF89_22365 [Nocardioides carbamazepini]|uniref:hypothetical protein n=1 Tax=Nocardioides carbamazepini TaxID=2854259 RepID=UPI002149F7B8|nr:hypothetical protein [Nocardioides carbamazepini]MCR1785301.1 hypothetical protein [Nocardioides carbamazepini]
MTHVQIQIGGGREPRLLVDNTDITKHVLADSVSVDVGDATGRPSRVHLTLLANVLDLDIEDAEVDAQMVEVEQPRRLCEERTDG